MRKYEITAAVKDDQVSLYTEQIKKIFEEYSIKIDKEENWGSKKLWHPVRHISSATYIHFLCEMSPKIVSDLEYSFKINENILKSLVVKVDGK